MLFLKEADIKASLSMAAAIEVDKQALANYSAGNAQVPLRPNLDVADAEGQNLYMPAYLAGEQEALGVKLVSVYPHNDRYHLPSVPATMVVQDPKTGIVKAILDGTYLTQLRTGAVQGAATDLLANPQAKIGALIGTGGQGQAQLAAMLAVRDLDEVRVFDLDAQRKQAFVARLQPHYQCRLVAASSAQECVHDADVITTVTTSSQATFEAAWVKAGAHINGVGAYTPQMHELPAALLSRADVIIFDTMAGVLKEAGDIITPLQDGIVKRSDYQGELGQLINGDLTGRPNTQAITVFKTVGSAVLDVAVANAIVKQAQAKQLGTEI